MHDAPLLVLAKLTKGAVPYDVCHRAPPSYCPSPQSNLPLHVPHGRPWMWASGHSAATVKRAAHGYEPTREAAMAAFAKSWRRG
jgi:hypothetical protein